MKDLLHLLLFSAIFSLGIAWAAGQRDRSPGAWFFISLLLSPIVAAIILALAGRGQPRATHGSSSPGDLSRLSEDDLAVLQQHQAAQRAAASQRRHLPQRLDS